MLNLFLAAGIFCLFLCFLWLVFIPKNFFWVLVFDHDRDRSDFLVLGAVALCFTWGALTILWGLIELIKRI